MTLFCSTGCNTPITERAKTGMCGKCAATARWFDPQKVANHKAGVIAGAARRMAKPGELERMRGQMTAARAALDAEVYARAARTRDRTNMGWCPSHYRALNAEMRHRGIALAERKRMIADQVAADERRRLTAMTPLERQVERVRQGKATVSERVPMPSRTHAFTLGGVAPEAM